MVHRFSIFRISFTILNEEVSYETTGINSIVPLFRRRNERYPDYPKLFRSFSQKRAPKMLKNACSLSYNSHDEWPLISGGMRCTQR